MFVMKIWRYSRLISNIYLFLLSSVYLAMFNSFIPFKTATLNHMLQHIGLCCAPVNY